MNYRDFFIGFNINKKKNNDKIITNKVLKFNREVQNNYNNINTKIYFFKYNKYIKFLNKLDKNNINILLNNDNIYDLDFDNVYYNEINNLNDNFESFKNKFIKTNNNYRFGDLDLFKFDIIYGPNLETYNFELSNRFIDSKYNSLENIKNRIKNLVSQKENINKTINNKNIIYLIPYLKKKSLDRIIEDLSKQNVLFENIYIFDSFINKEKYLNKYLNSINIIKLENICEKEIFLYLKNNNINFEYIIFIDQEFILNKNFVKNVNNDLVKNSDVNTIIFRYSKNRKINPDINFIEINNEIKFNICISRNVLFNKFDLNKNIYDNITNMEMNNQKILISKYLINVNDYDDKYYFGNFILNGNKHNMIKYIDNNVNISIINLDNRKGRYISTIQEVKKLNIKNINRFSAIKPSINDIINSKIIDLKKLWQFTSLEDDLNRKYVIGASGCKFSHYQLLKNINDNNNKKYHLILEDDCLFRNNIVESLYNCIKFFESNNINFNMLYLGSNIKTKNDFKFYNDKMIKCNKGGCFSTHAILHNVKNISNTIKIIENSKAEIDVTFLEVDNRFVINPMVAIQRDDVSDISKYKEFHVGGKMWKKGEDGKIFYGDMDKIKFLNK